MLARADKAPDAVAYESIDTSGLVSTLTYSQVASRAGELAGRLAEGGDGPVLIALPAGLDYPVAVFAGFLAGRPVIPAFPPDYSSTPDRTRLAGIVADARPSTLVARERYPELGVPDVLRVPGAEADGGKPHVGPEQDIAVIQYTSGSTGRPRGVLVRHEGLAANTAAIAEKFGLDPESRALTWLPPFHDMGLVGGLLTPMAAGIPIRIMQPGDFLKAPLWWLRQIGETGATHTGGPNFGYDLCVRRANRQDALDGLDLSSWRVAFSGAEAVKHRTMTEFAAKFAPAGFRPEAFLPSYGLAEATLMVSAGHWSPTAGEPDGPVSCGTPVAGQRVAVVDPENLTPVADGAEGEIWIAGRHITSGYLSHESGELFGELDGVRHLRTGDLGFLRDGDLYVSGRAKDVIVHRGVNYHAVDVEAAALDTVGRAGRTAAAFLVETPTGSVPVLALEVHGSPGASLAADIRTAVLARTRLRLEVVALVGPRSLPRTSSGKVRRSAARDAFLAGAFDDAVVSGRDRLAALEPGRARIAATADLTSLVCGIIAGTGELPDCKPTDELTALGVDSLRAAEAAAVLEHALGLPVPLETVLTSATPERVAAALMTGWLADGHDAALVRTRMESTHEGAGVV
ncbi:non-ribosomal peptide synthetase [Streptomyces sp. NPDC091215]|uniref:non-ribosomal peptide synthetase n=1 Tax=Streptomyces sp. NPDC091215 TaxID=3155192 RepID=UPI0034411EE8